MKRPKAKYGGVPGTREVHRYEPTDRGVEHIHRWRGGCSCGWVGKNHRRQQDAKREFTETHRDRAKRTTLPRPVRPTAAHLLPEALR